MYRWLLTIGLSIATVVSVYFFNQQHVDFKQQVLRIDSVQSQISDLNNARKSLETQKKHAINWKQLSEKVRASNFDPDRWELYPVSIHSRLSWNRFAELMLSISNANTRKSGYWFRPKTLSVSSPTPQTGTLLQNIADIGQSSPTEPSIQVGLDGAFLIRQ